MRYHPEHKKETRDRIVQNAARQFRAKGLGGPGVASVMKASGLTVGGFYKHFRNKDELLADAIAQGFAESSENIRFSLKDVPPEDRWKKLVRVYLSIEHCDRPETGCPIAALAPEIARAKSAVRRRVVGLMKEWVEIMPGATATERERNFFVIFSAIAGAVSVARILTETSEKQKVLRWMRDHLLQSF